MNAVSTENVAVKFPNRSPGASVALSPCLALGQLIAVQPPSWPTKALVCLPVVWCLALVFNNKSFCERNYFNN